ncbi:hypothetical protein AB0E75_09315 [Streptomyces griseoviridis]|uniref:Uncharacterized protein n=3 Tax=Streptomyces TaxID=1883 RepID=A0ABT9LDE9_STRGD|nr:MULTISPECIES: hypothetical protein [Streptomyces]MDP9680782.1 hypothetical protein [Streptomyces griseoviridis]
MSPMELWRRARRADGPAAPVVCVANSLLGCLLLLLAIGVFTDPATRAEESALQGLGLRIFLSWLLGGAVLFAVLGMARTLLWHVTALLLAPGLLVAGLLVL